MKKVKINQEAVVLLVTSLLVGWSLGDWIILLILLVPALVFVIDGED